MKIIPLSLVVIMMTFGHIECYIPSDSSFFKAFGLVDRIKTISNALTEEDGPLSPKSPLDAFPAVNPHEEPQKLSSTLFNFFKKRPQLNIKSRIFDPEAISSFLNMFHPLTGLGSDQPSSAPSYEPQPIIPANLPGIVPVPLPFRVAPVRIVFPTIPKDNVVPLPSAPETSVTKGQYLASKRLRRRRI